MSKTTGPPRSDDGRFWFDGEQWCPMPESPARQHNLTLTIVAGVTLALVVVIIGLWVVNGLSHSSDNLQCETQNAQRAQGGLPALACPQ